MMPALIRNIVFLAWFAVAASPVVAQAQSPEDFSQDLNGFSAILDTIDAALQREGISDDQILERRIQANGIATRAKAITIALQPSVTALTERRNALLPDKAEDGEVAPGVESAELVREREAIEESLTAVEELSKRSAAIATRANQLATRAAEIERDRFARQIFERDETILNPGFWRVFLADLPATFSGIELVSGDITRRFASKGAIGLVPPLLFLLSLALVIVPRLRHGMVNLIAKRFGHDKPTELSKAIVAVLVAGFVMLAPVAGLYLARFLATILGLAAPSLQSVGDRAVLALLVISACTGFARAILAPNRPDWRVAVAGEVEVHKLTRYLRWSAGIVAAGIFLQGVAAAANVPQSNIVMVGSFLCLGFASMIWLSLKHYRAILDEETGLAGTGRIKYSRILRLFGMAGSLVMLVIAGSTLLGFVPLAWFLSKQVVWISIVLATYALISNLIDALVGTFEVDGPVAGRIARFSGLSRSALTQLGIVFFGLFKLLLVSVALAAAAAPWGFKSVSVFEQAHTLLTGFQVGGLQISLSTIAEGIMLFVLGLFVTRSLRNWLGEHLLPATSLDTGLKNSITTTTGYLGFILSVVIAFAFVGIDLSQLGLVAGALSVGIGFGLQSIVNNFVSGLILLAERPIKAGDWIIVGGEEGTVKKINVRATELETFDRASVVIPNSDLISGTVRNWVLGGSMGRASLVVGVGYSSDADQVRELLLACANDHDLVLAFPEPAVFFLDFGDSALLFRLDTYLADIGNGFRLRSDLRFEILRRFREAGIEIPFPQRDLNIRSSDELTEVIDQVKSTVS